MLENVVYKSRNMILQHLERTNSDIAVIVGPGHTIAVDESDNLTFSDPLFTPPKHNKSYGDYNVFMYYYTLGGSGLEAAGNELAQFINQHMSQYKKVILHGHSKSGLDFLVLASMSGVLMRRVSVVSVSAPLEGTPVANLKAFSSTLSTVEKFFYLKIFSNHSVDKDICPGAKFISKLDLNTAFKQHDCYIIVSKCGMSIKPIDWILRVLNSKWKIYGDGVVPFKSQIQSNRALPCEVIVASHATSLEKSVQYVMDLK